MTNLPALARWYINSCGGNRTDINQLIINAFAKKAQLGLNHDLLAQLPLTTVFPPAHRLKNPGTYR